MRHGKLFWRRINDCKFDVHNKLYLFRHLDLFSDEGPLYIISASNKRRRNFDRVQVKIQAVLVLEPQTSVIILIILINRSATAILSPEKVIFCG